MIYLVVIFILFFFLYFYDVLKYEVGKTFSLVVSFIILTLLVGLRFRMGGDSLSYEEIYYFMPSLKELIENGLYPYDFLIVFQPLWIILNGISVSISKNFVAFQLIHATLINALLFFYLYRNSKQPFTVLFFLFITHYYFYFVIEIEREVLAIGVFLLNFKNLQKKKWLSYYLLCTVSFLFHISAAILFFLPLFKRFRLTQKQLIIILLTLTPLIFFKDFFISVLRPIFFLQFLQDKLNDYSQIDLSIAGVLFNYLLRVVFFMPFIFYNYIYKKYEEYQWMFNLMAILSVLSLSLVGIERFLNYFIIVYIVIFVDFVYTNKIIPQKKYVTTLIIIFTSINLLSGIPRRLISTNKRGTPYYYLFYPYTSVFDKKVMYEREKFMEESWDELSK